MNYFLDTEFIEKPNTIQLISIGIVCEDGREYYALSSEYNYEDANDWVKENVIKPLYEKHVGISLRDKEFTIENFHKMLGTSISRIRKGILKFVGYPKYKTGKPKFWGYFADYDWVVFSWIFGRMIDLPEGFPMYCRDLKQIMDAKNVLSLPAPEGEHDVMVDARWNRDLYKYLMEGKMCNYFMSYICRRKNRETGFGNFVISMPPVINMEIIEETEKEIKKSGDLVDVTIISINRIDCD